MMTLSWNEKNILTIAPFFLKGSVVVMPTDTIYGTLSLATNHSSVQRVYDLKERNPQKPPIILISHISQLRLFKVRVNRFQNNFLKKYWPGPVSVILPCDQPEFTYLHRGTKSLAFRLPSNSLLCDLIDITGPLIAPSANPEGQVPATNIKEANGYFGDQVTLYVDGGDLTGNSSTLVSLLSNPPAIIRGQLEVK